eukprot:CAMPEP_0183727990 /NCGR_PEP_ID=MMETSP0737-20130205/26938_1 /TAXON_ID=385413 /ORGANISM="Thalassiosira miniscula, Strain CCMP1093" /LENGTH=465 /DNA_ID=CAMNT_0025959793 /DNA_START=48 /DNA_END=1442 /DNA_ORIENTATION=+
MPPVNEMEATTNDTATTTSTANDAIMTITADLDAAQSTSYDSADVANAEHLDRLEASNAVADIASFSDVDLETNANDANNAANAANADNTASTAENPPTIRRAKRFYYCLPMMIQYRFAIGSCLLLLALLLTAVILSAQSLQRSNEALAEAILAEEEARANNKNDGGAAGSGGEWLQIDDLPKEDEWGLDIGYEWSGGNDGGWGGQGGTSGAKGQAGEGEEAEWIEDENENTEDHDEEVGEALEATPEAPPEYVPREDDLDDEGGDELGDLMEVVITSSPTDAPREVESPSYPTEGQLPPPTIPSPTPPTQSVANEQPNTTTETKATGVPVWYHTSNPAYQTFLTQHNNPDEQFNGNNLASLFCADQSKRLCTYNEYCPSGKGSDPYHDPNTQIGKTHKGPPISTSDPNVQWAPTTVDGNASDVAWVQVGTVPEDQMGNESNDYDRCWTWDDFDKNTNAILEDVW